MFVTFQSLPEKGSPVGVPFIVVICARPSPEAPATSPSPANSLSVIIIFLIHRLSQTVDRLLQPPKIFSVSRLPPILLPFLALVIATPAPAAPAENAGDRILTTPARETTVARESRLRTTLTALAPADFSAAAEATRTEFARLLVLDVERDFAEAISLLEPLLARLNGRQP